ncbi:hypothetical protein EWM64_g2878 [Hericium alpestre]|uniref:Uncharacterized protein n=1 Tax=Hericium alpestre TaxID=135208 RepID=A0A4Z0A489_9AGAM|nr:hypothetical protein EWM64_g2878 [Hericium alpestre]
MSLSALNKLCNDTALQETIGRVNRLISAWPSDDTPPAEGIDGVKTIYKKLTSALNDIKANSDKEVK